MSRIAGRVGLAVLMALLLGACISRSPDEPEKVEPPFVPDDRGVVTSVSVQTMELDGKRSFPINAFVRSFSAYLPAESEPVLKWKNRYVHIGLNDAREIIWIAGIGVVDRGIDPPTVYYTNGVIEDQDEGRLFLKDGTVFDLKEGLEVPSSTMPLTLHIDINKNEVYRFVPRGT